MRHAIYITSVSLSMLLACGLGIYLNIIAPEMLIDVVFDVICIVAAMWLFLKFKIIKAVDNATDE